MKRMIIALIIMLLCSLTALAYTREELLDKLQSSHFSIKDFKLGGVSTTNRPIRLSGYLEQIYITNDWENSNAFGYLFDTQGRISGWITKVWNNEDQLWQWDWKQSISYLPDGRYDRIDQFYYDGEWLASGYLEFVYNGTQVDFIISYFVWEEEEYLSSAAVFGYNPQSTHVEYITQMSYWEDRYVFRRQFTYDDQGRPNATVFSYSWDGIDWQDDQRTNISYHASDTSGYSHFYDFVINEYALSNYVLPQMFMPFKVSLELGSYYDVEFSTWVQSHRTEYLYDQDNRLEYKDLSYYESWEQDWVHSNRFAYQYSDDGLLDNTIYYYVDYDGNLYESSKWNFSYEEYVHTDDENHSPAPVAINAYPNPFREGVQILLSISPKANSALGIYNARGQKVRTLSSTATANTPTSFYWDGKDEKGISVCNGIYWIKTQTETGPAVRKILKLR